MTCRRALNHLGRPGLFTIGSAVELIEEGAPGLLFVGNDWAEAHHDVELVDQSGAVLVRRRLLEGVSGLATLHALIADHLGENDEPDQVLVGIETDRGPWVQALIAAGYSVYPINPLQVARYRERHGVAGAKSDPGDAHVLAEIVRLDRAHHRPAAGDTTVAEGVRLAARAHQTMIWTRQRSGNTLRSLLREFYPAALAAFGDDLAGRDALAILAAAPDPQRGRQLSVKRVVGLLSKAGRQRNLDRRAGEIVEALRAEQLGARPGLDPVYAVSVSALVAVISEMVTQTAVLEELVRAGFGQHPDAEIYLSPGSDRSSPPGCWPSSATTLSATPKPEHARTTPEWHRSRKRPGPNASSWPATPGTGGSPTPSTSRPSAPSPFPPAHGPSTTDTAIVARPTTRHCAPSPTGSSASSTAAYATTPATTKPPHGRPSKPRPLDSFQPWDI
jgi:transposase